MFGLSLFFEKVWSTFYDNKWVFTCYSTISEHTETVDFNIKNYIF